MTIVSCVAPRCRTMNYSLCELPLKSAESLTVRTPRQNPWVLQRTTKIWGSSLYLFKSATAGAKKDGR